MHDMLLHEQLAYYRARAPEYDESQQGHGRYAAAPPPPDETATEWTRMVQALHAAGSELDVLELACGTGVWTRELLPIARSITALDGSPEMLALNRANVADARVRYEHANLFDWQPARQYDLVFFAAWLSHVPPALLDGFLDAVRRAVRVGGQIFMVDEPGGGAQLSGPNEDGVRQTRALHDGRTFQIIKVYYEPNALAQRLRRHGFGQIDGFTGTYFFCLTGVREA